MSGARRFFWCVLRLGFAYPKKYKLEKERNTMNKVEDFINPTKLNDLLNKKEEMINMTKLNELLDVYKRQDQKRGLLWGKRWRGVPKSECTDRNSYAAFRDRGYHCTQPRCDRSCG